MNTESHRLLHHLAHRRLAQFTEMANLARRVAVRSKELDVRLAALDVAAAAAGRRAELKDVLHQIDRLDAATAERVFAPNEVCAGCRSAICAPGALFCPDCPYPPP